jgi:hypothetical protein
VLIDILALKMALQTFPEQNNPERNIPEFFWDYFGIAFRDFWKSVSGSNGKPILT